MALRKESALSVFPDDRPIAEVDTAALTRLARKYANLRDRIDAFSRKLSDMKDEREQLEDSLIEGLKSAGMKSMRLSSGELLTRAERNVYKLPPKSDQTRLKRVLAWLRRVKLGDAIENTVHWSTFNARMRERAERGLPMHEDVQLMTEEVIQLRRNGAKSEGK